MKKNIVVYKRELFKSRMKLAKQAKVSESNNQREFENPSSHTIVFLHNAAFKKQQIKYIVSVQ